MNTEKLSAKDKLLAYAERFVAFCLARPREMGFSALLLIIALAGIYQSTPAMVDHVFELQIKKNGKSIRTINDKRDITAEKIVWVDKLMLKDGYHLVHPKLGAIGYGNNYWIDIEGEFEVKKAGKYFFYPGSDDGFRLSVDGEQLCEFIKDRGYATRSCPKTLEEGKHTFKLVYFQGSGHSALTLAYRHREAKKRKWFGENSRYISFD